MTRARIIAKLRALASQENHDGEPWDTMIEAAAELEKADRVGTTEASKTADPTECTALFGVKVWNPLEHHVHGMPLMVPAHEYNRVASNLADALSLAFQHVPLNHPDSEEITRLEKQATIPV